jgi:hypothetical protein
MQLGETVLTSPAVPFAVIVEVDGAPGISRISPVLMLLWTVTTSTGTLADERVTPVTVVG